MQPFAADGTAKSIEDMRPGDRVESRAETGDEHGRMGVATVERAFELRAPSTLLLRFADGASLEVTAVHPLYAVGRGFTAAGELRVGDRVAEAKDGEAATLASVVRLGTPKPVYNLTVGGTHTYFVRAGEDDLWAHNADDCDLSSPGRREHILDGDPVGNGGGHRGGTGKPGKSEFPPNWSDDEVMHEISDVATDPSSHRFPQGDREVAEGTRGLIDIRVILGGPGEDPIITGFPTNIGRNP